MYSVRLEKPAQKDIHKLDKPLQKQIFGTLRKLSTDPFSSEPLKGGLSIPQPDVSVQFMRRQT